MTPDLQASRRLGLTATLICEDGCESEVFSLIGQYLDQLRTMAEQLGAGLIAGETHVVQRQKTLRLLQPR